MKRYVWLTAALLVISAGAQEPDRVHSILEQKVVEYRVLHTQDSVYVGPMTAQEVADNGYRARIGSAYLVIQKVRVLRDGWTGPAKRWIAQEIGGMPKLLTQSLGKEMVETTRYGLFLRIHGREHIFNTPNAWDRNRRSRVWNFCELLNQPSFNVRVNHHWNDSAGFDGTLNKDYLLKGTLPENLEDSFEATLDFMFKNDRRALGGYRLSLVPECIQSESVESDLISESLAACGGKSTVYIP